MAWPGPPLVSARFFRSVAEEFWTALRRAPALPIEISRRFLRRDSQVFVPFAVSIIRSGCQRNGPISRLVAFPAPLVNYQTVMRALERQPTSLKEACSTLLPHAGSIYLELLNSCKSSVSKAQSPALAAFGESVNLNLRSQQCFVCEAKIRILERSRRVSACRLHYAPPARWADS
jgi:hypothetical protein